MDFFPRFISLCSPLLRIRKDFALSLGLFDNVSVICFSIQICWTRRGKIFPPRYVTYYRILPFPCCQVPPYIIPMMKEYERAIYLYLKHDIIVWTKLLIDYLEQIIESMSRITTRLQWKHISNYDWSFFFVIRHVWHFVSFASGVSSYFIQF